MHAEVSAIINAIKTVKNPKMLQNAELYVVQWYRRPNQQREEVMRCSKPCDNCKRMIEKYRIKKVYYSTAESTKYFM